MNIAYKVYRAPRTGGYGMVAVGYPIFAFGKTLDVTRARYDKACRVYFGL